MKAWFEIENTDGILTPALLFYPDRIKPNIDQMIHLSGSVDRLRPHVKTYKCPQIVQMQLDAGITKFKCATFAEAEMLANLKVTDVLIAYPLIGPAQTKFIELINKFPETRFAALIDHLSQVESWQKIIRQPIDIFIDLNVGMNRTGIKPEETLELYNKLESRYFNFKGIHVYDGHIHDVDLKKRQSSVDQSYAPVQQFLDQISNKDIEICCGGSISFPIHAEYSDRTLSPGTTLLWDYGYAQYTDLKFDIAATVMTRVISKPSENKLCLDLGHKAVASEMKDTPVFFPQIPDASIVTHSEEHLVLEIRNSENWNIGDVLYAFPRHICPTVALHESACVINNGKFTELWNIQARNRNYTL